ncbi:hypothetical protein BS639_23995 [Rouxiella silvae]|uniref:DUF4747 domain-containing protein n=1 Tax=Rouxiella silvae TaxID=1646373 RepID=A0ABX3TTZ7_9GAMM|nr:DUF6731 family protein [Rouxiella silvae]ORJ18693.1 hypothetical protein BS639_23995 [Rouxiella silvae]
MPFRDYKIEFYQLNLSPTAEIPTIRALLSLLETDDHYLTSLAQGGYTREIWGLVYDRFPDTICGQFRKFRTTDIPEIGQVGGDSQVIELNENEGLIEKNFFVYYEEHSIIAWHKNGHSSRVIQFANFLSSCGGCKISAGPVLQPDAISRLMSGNIELKKIELTIPRPTNPELYPEDDYGRGLIEMMNNLDADSLKLSLGVDLRRADSEGKLSNRLKNTLRAIVETGATTARAHVFENGVEHPIDLIADRVVSNQSVETDAHFPPSFTMYGIINTAKTECQGELDDYFGALEDAID